MSGVFSVVTVIGVKINVLPCLGPSLVMNCLAQNASDVPYLVALPGSD